MDLWARLKDHKVLQWGLAYAGAALAIAHGQELMAHAFSWPGIVGRIVMALLVLGFPVALTLSWYHGHKGLKQVSQGELLIAALLLLLGAGLLSAFVRVPAEHAGETSAGITTPEGAAALPQAALSAIRPNANSIAVLPFADLSPGSDQQYFSDGIAEEILNVLARIEGLKVASRTSSFQFRGQALGAPAIAKELGVRHILEGSVRKAGATIRITAQLIDAETDGRLWSEAFDRPLTTETVFATQDDIANAIVGALRQRLGAEVGDAQPAAVPTGDVDAYELYLQARVLVQARRELNTADELLAEAVVIDPQFADALAIRAAIHQFGGEYGGDFGNAREGRRTGRVFAEQALAINDANSLALAAMALSHLFDHIEGFGTESYDAIFGGFDRALALDPNNSNALNWQGIAYGFSGYNQKAADSYRRCISVDSALAACRQNLAGELISLGRNHEASAIMDAAADFGAVSQSAGVLIVLAELQRRDAFMFLSTNVRALQGWRKFGALYDALRDSGGDHRALAAELETFLDQNDASTQTYGLLNALGAFERPVMLTHHWVPSMRRYHQSSEFKEHMRASDLPDYWRENGFPPQCRPVRTDDFECN